MAESQQKRSESKQPRPVFAGRSDGRSFAAPYDFPISACIPWCVLQTGADRGWSGKRLSADAAPLCFRETITAAFENPTYPRAWKIFQLFAGEVVTVSSDASGICIEDLEKSGAQVVYVMPSHQYPTGRMMPIGRRTELLNWAAREKERYIIEDDYDSEFRYRGKPVPSLQASDAAGKVVYMGTFSKSIAPAIRVGYMVLPEALLERYRQKCACFSCTVSRVDQAVLEQFLDSGAFERHLNRMRKSYSRKHEALLDGLKPFLGNLTFRGKMRDCTFCLRIASDAAKRACRRGTPTRCESLWSVVSACGGSCPGGCVSRNRFDRLWRPDGGRNPGWSGAACSGVADRKKIVIFRDKYRIIGVDEPDGKRYK